MNSSSNNKISNTTSANNTKAEKSGNQDMSTGPVRPMVKPTIPRKIVTLEQTQLMDCLPGTGDPRDGNRSNKEMLKTIQMWMVQGAAQIWK